MLPATRAIHQIVHVWGRWGGCGFPEGPFFTYVAAGDDSRRRGPPQGGKSVEGMPGTLGNPEGGVSERCPTPSRINGVPGETRDLDVNDMAWAYRANGLVATRPLESGAPNLGGYNAEPRARAERVKPL